MTDLDLLTQVAAGEVFDFCGTSYVGCTGTPPVTAQVETLWHRGFVEINIGLAAPLLHRWTISDTGRDVLAAGSSN